jgi:ABC-type phosphate/phosphonate transport system substrate-binding protein
MAWKIAFPMYNVAPAIADGYAALFDALVAQLRADGWHAPIGLERDPPLPAFWMRPDMLLSQTCGYPFLTQLRDHVKLIATPAYDFPGCHGSSYSSAIVVRAGGAIASLADARGATAAVNDPHSNSGMNALRHAVAPLAEAGRFFGAVKWSGSHRASLALVHSGQADIAAIDCVTLGYLRQQLPDSLDGLTILDYSATSPCLPFIASNAVPQALQRALREALLAPSPVLATLLPALSIRAFTLRGADDYAHIGALEAQARAVGYPQLA